MGESDEYTYIDYAHSDENTFGIKIHGDSMSPTLVPGDIVIVVPSAELENASCASLLSRAKTETGLSNATPVRDNGNPGKR